MTRRLALGITGAALLGLAACSTPSNTPQAYGDETRANFVAACTAATEDVDSLDEVDGPTVPDQPAVPVDVCECRYQWQVDNVPFDDQDQEERFGDYDGPTFVDLQADASEDGAVPADIIDEMDRACPLEGSGAEGEGEGEGDEATTTTEEPEGSTSTTPATSTSADDEAGDDTSTSTTEG